MPTYLITGATGQQGGATARALLSSGHQIHALVRTPTSAASLALQSLGATLFPGSFTDVDSLIAAARGCSGVFLNVTPSFTDPAAEVEHAKNIIRAAQTAGVKHVVYSSVLKTGQHLSFPNWDPDSWIGSYWLSKHAVEEAVRGGGFETWTIVRPGTFMSNFLLPTSGFMFPELWGEGEALFKSAYLPQTTLALVDVSDIGAVAARVLQDGGKWGGREIDIFGEELSVRETVSILADVRGKAIKLVGFEKGEEEQGIMGLIAAMQRFINDVQSKWGAGDDLSALKETGVHMRGWREFLEGEKAAGGLSG